MGIILQSGEEMPPADQPTNEAQQERKEVPLPSPAVLAKFYGLPTSPIQQHQTWEFDSAAKLYHPPLDLIFYHSAAATAVYIQSLTNDIFPKVMQLVKDIVIIHHTVRNLEKEMLHLKSLLDTETQTIN